MKIASLFFTAAALVGSVTAQSSSPSVTPCPVVSTTTVTQETSFTTCPTTCANPTAVSTNIANSVYSLPQTVSTLLSSVSVYPAPVATQGIIDLGNNFISDVAGIDNTYGTNGILTLSCLSSRDVRSYIRGVDQALFLLDRVLGSAAQFQLVLGTDSFNQDIAPQWINSINQILVDKSQNIMLAGGCLDCGQIASLNARIAGINTNYADLFATIGVSLTETLGSDCGVVTSSTTTQGECPVTEASSSVASSSAAESTSAVSSDSSSVADSSASSDVSSATSSDVSSATSSDVSSATSSDVSSATSSDVSSAASSYASSTVSSEASSSASEAASAATEGASSTAASSAASSEASESSTSSAEPSAIASVSVSVNSTASAVADPAAASTAPAANGTAAATEAARNYNATSSQDPEGVTTSTITSTFVSTVPCPACAGGHSTATFTSTAVVTLPCPKCTHSASAEAAAGTATVVATDVVTEPCTTSTTTSAAQNAGTATVVNTDVVTVSCTTSTGSEGTDVVLLTQIITNTKTSTNTLKATATAPVQVGQLSSTGVAVVPSETSVNTAAVQANAAPVKAISMCLALFVPALYFF